MHFIPSKAYRAGESHACTAKFAYGQIRQLTAQIRRPPGLLTRLPLLPHHTPCPSFIINCLLQIEGHFSRNLKAAKVSILNAMAIIIDVPLLTVNFCNASQGRGNPALRSARHPVLNTQPLSGTFMKPRPPALSGCVLIMCTRCIRNLGGSPVQQNDEHLILQRLGIELGHPCPEGLSMIPIT